MRDYLDLSATRVGEPCAMVEKTGDYMPRMRAECRAFAHQLERTFPQAIEAAFPQTRIQTCIVHLLRHSMNFANYKDRKAVAAALKAIYTAVDAAAAEQALAEFEESDLARRYPAIAPSWRRAWNEVIPFLDYPPEVRRLIYTTNAIEALNSKIRRAVRTRGHFPSDDAAAKLIYLALNATSNEWKRSVRDWHAVRSQFAIMFEDRIPMT